MLWGGVSGAGGEWGFGGNSRIRGGDFLLVVVSVELVCSYYPSLLLLLLLLRGLLRWDVGFISVCGAFGVWSGGCVLVFSAAGFVLGVMW